MAFFLCTRWCARSGANECVLRFCCVSLSAGVAILRSSDSEDELFDGPRWNHPGETIEAQQLLAAKYARVESHTIRTSGGALVSGWIWVDFHDRVCSHFHLCFACVQREYCVLLACKFRNTHIASPLHLVSPFPFCVCVYVYVCLCLCLCRYRYRCLCVCVCVSFSFSLSVMWCGHSILPGRHPG